MTTLEMQAFDDSVFTEYSEKACKKSKRRI